MAITVLQSFKRISPSCPMTAPREQRTGRFYGTEDPLAREPSLGLRVQERVLRHFGHRNLAAKN